MAKKQPATTTSFRFDSDTFELLDELSRRLDVSKTDLVRDAIEVLRDLLLVAQADGNALLAVLRDRRAYTLRIDVALGSDGRPQPRVLIDGKEHVDVTAKAAVIDRKAYIFLEVGDANSSIAVRAGDEALLVRPRFALSGPIPWPPSGDVRIEIPVQASTAEAVPVPARTVAR